MNSTTRYILTATAVAGGLFVVGATANGIVTRDDAPNEVLGDPVVVPSAETTAPTDTEVVDTPVTDLAPLPSPEPEKTKKDKGSDDGWKTSTGKGSDDDDEDDDDHDEDDDEDDDDDHDEHDDDHDDEDDD